MNSKKILLLLSLFAFPLASCTSTTGQTTSKEETTGGSETTPDHEESGKEEGEKQDEEEEKEEQEQTTFTVNFSELFGDDESSFEVTDTMLASDLKLSVKNGANSPVKYFVNGKAMRVYAGDSIIFTSTGGNITKIELTISQDDSKVTVSSSPSGIEDKSVWSGDASIVTINVEGSSGHMRYSAVKITYGGAGDGSEDEEEHSEGDDPITTYDAESICDLIAAKYGTTSSYDLEDGIDIFYFTAKVGAKTSFTLESAVEDVISKLPSVIDSYYSETHADTWDDGDAGYFAEYCDNNETVEVDIGSYLSGNDVYVQVDCFDLI